MENKQPTKQEKKFAFKIKELRDDLEYSLEEAGKKIGISKAVLYKYETNETIRIPLDKIEAIAKAYNVTPAYLCGWEEKKYKYNNSWIDKGKNAIKEILLGITTAWTGLITAFILLVFGAPYAVIGLSSVGIVTLIAFLSYEDSKENKKLYKEKFRNRILLITLGDMFKESKNYDDFKKHCCYSLMMSSEVTNWQDKIFDLFLKTAYITAIMIKNKKIDKFFHFRKSSPFYKEVMDDIENNKKMSA